MSLYAIHKQAAPPSGVSHCISARLTPSCLQQQQQYNNTRIVRNLVTARSNYLQVYEVVEEEVLGRADKEEDGGGYDAIEVSVGWAMLGTGNERLVCYAVPYTPEADSPVYAMQCIAVPFHAPRMTYPARPYHRSRTASQTQTRMATARPQYMMEALQVRPGARLQLPACTLSANTACTGQSPACSGSRPSTRHGMASTGCSSPSRMQKCVQSRSV